MSELKVESPPQTLHGVFRVLARLPSDLLPAPSQPPLQTRSGSGCSDNPQNITHLLRVINVLAYGQSIIVNRFVPLDPKRADFCSVSTRARNTAFAFSTSIVLLRCLLSQIIDN